MSAQCCFLLVEKLITISGEFDASYAHSCAASLIIFQKSFPESSLRFCERDEWAQIILDGIVVWLKNINHEGQLVPVHGLVYELEICLFKDDNSMGISRQYRSISATVQTIKGIYDSFFQASRNVQSDESRIPKQLELIS